MEKEKMMECAMQIIAYAGSAFDYFNRAIEAAEEGQLEEARQYLADGKNELRHAHDAQTDLLAAEARGEDLPFSILMVHAQDHLMNAILMKDMANSIIKLNQKVASMK